MASAKNLCAYVYASAGPTESTKDVVYGGHCLIMEDGVPLAVSDRFDFGAHHIVADIDTAKLRHDRKQNTTFRQAPRPAPYRIQRCAEAQPLNALKRSIAKHPFVPSDEHEFDARAREILSIQTTGLARRMRAAHSDKLVIGLSGGLDSTLALLVCLDAVDKLEIERSNVQALTLPGPGTSSHTLDNARRLASTSAVSLQEISIDKAVAQHLQDLDHGGDHDIVFENAQARERTAKLATPPLHADLRWLGAVPLVPARASKIPRRCRSTSASAPVAQVSMRTSSSRVWGSKCSTSSVPARRYTHSHSARRRSSSASSSKL